jgi:hypothetical protein
MINCIYCSKLQTLKVILNNRSCIFCLIAGIWNKLPLSLDIGFATKSTSFLPTSSSSVRQCRIRLR